MLSGVTHTEFIRSKEDGRFYFLETAARVGGAYIAELVEFSKGLNPWVEWARIEMATLMGLQYFLPKLKGEYAGSVICLAKQEEPNLDGYTDPEVVMRLKKHHHAGLIVESASAERVERLLEAYGPRFLEEFCASQPVPEKPSA
jgi:biotin carboxylase